MELLNVGNELTGTYDLALVVVSVFIATIASYVTLLIAEYFRDPREPWRTQWLVGGAFALGLGIWLMHFLGMIALQLPVGVAYEPLLTFVSIIPGIAASAIFVYVVTQPFSVLRANVGGLSMGAGIGAMHYVGMAAMQLEGAMTLVPWLVALSLVVGYLLATLALCSRQLVASAVRKAVTREIEILLSAILMGCAISGMHYTGMAAARFEFLPGASTLTGVSPDALVVPLSIGTSLVLLVLVFLVFVERRLRIAQSTMQRLLETAPDALIIVDADGLIRVANVRVETVFGYPRRELIGQPVEMLVPARSRESHLVFRGAFNEKPEDRAMSVNRDLLGLRRDGTEFPAEIMLSHAYSQGEMYVTCSIRDITERMKAREEKEGLEVQLREAQKMEAVGRLAGGIAHDFNNILTGIGGYAELMEMKPGAEDAEELKQIRGLVDRATSLTRQLLTFSRKQAVEKEVFDLTSLVRSLQSMMRGLIRNDIDLVVELGEEDIFIDGSPGQLEQVVVNLLINAMDAINGAGEIRVSVETIRTDASHAKLGPGDWVSLKIQDNGTGMSPAVLQKVFDPFFTTKPVGKGTGLGLAVVFGVIEPMGGTVEAQSEEGVGSTFTVILPRVPARASGKQVEETGPVPKGSETILIAEDELVVRTFVTRTLTESGYHVIEAEDGRAALEMLDSRAGQVDMVLTDIVMPRMGGRELVRECRSRYPGVKTYFMSGYQADDGTEAEMAVVLEKPFRARELLATVRTVLDEAV